MKSKEMNKINRWIQKMKEMFRPAPKVRTRIAGRTNRERNQAKRQSRKLRGK